MALWTDSQHYLELNLYCQYRYPKAVYVNNNYNLKQEPVEDRLSYALNFRPVLSKNRLKIRLKNKRSFISFLFRLNFFPGTIDISKYILKYILYILGRGFTFK